MTSENRVIHLSQNGMESGYLAITTGWQMDKVIPGLQIAPKASKDILDAELGKPYMLL